MKKLDVYIQVSNINILNKNIKQYLKRLDVWTLKGL